MKEVEKLYLKGWQYNSYLIINKLAELIKQEGGKVVLDSPCINTYNEKEIVNRSILEEQAECERLLNGKTNKDISKNEYLQDKQKRLAELEKIDNTPKKVIFSNYIQFVLDNTIYYIQLQDNPFFEDYIIKEQAEKLNNNYIIKYNHYMENLSKKWIEDYSNINSFYENLTDKQIEELAKRLFEQLKNYRYSEIVTDKKRVQNYYDNRYHYEYIKQERKKIYKTLDII